MPADINETQHVAVIFYRSRGKRRGLPLIETAEKCLRSSVAIASAFRRSAAAITIGIDEADLK
ncbi:MAG: hypothetical protein DMG60_15550 [Acidobacteria bacterium]|nr:MAG: hypothetical protein DMG60_15550 [Acidobacteriota bacterium]